jgi:hypothetical protein
LGVAIPVRFRTAAGPLVETPKKPADYAETLHYNPVAYLSKAGRLCRFLRIRGPRLDA